MTETQTQATAKTPDDLVEDKVLERYATDGLLDAEGINALKGRISAGSLSAEDWKLAFENAVERECKAK